MNIRTFEVGTVAALLASVVAAVLIRGDSLYVGLWYYFAVPAVFIGLCALFRPAPPLLLGVNVALIVSFISYLSINWLASKPEGLLGLGHIFSLPGALVGSLAVAAAAKRYGILSPVALLFLGIGGTGGGFLINQLVVCNTVMWCGKILSFS
jgi:hypothetical protein